jgi:hypothetical protein
MTEKENMFYENLKHAIYENYFAKIPMNSTLADSTERWFNQLAKLKFESATDKEFLLNYLSDHPCDIKPTENDKEWLTHVSEDVLNILHFSLCTSLMALIEDDKENLESTENLHQFHLLVKAEMIRRGYEGMTETDSFIVDINKKNKGQLISIDKARKEGICPYCNSKEHIISYGDKWKCTACKKYFRKA